jgi:hypothetical protein
LSTEIEFKLEFGRMIHKSIEISEDEVKALKEYIHYNYSERYPVRIRRNRNSVVAFVIFVITLVSTIVGFQNLPFVTNILPLLLIILIITIVVGFIIYTIFTRLVDSVESKINDWISACDHLITNHLFLQGIISSMMFDINNISFYNIFLMREFTKLVMFS